MSFYPFSMKKRLVNICKTPEGEEPWAWPLWLRAWERTDCEEEHFVLQGRAPCPHLLPHLPAVSPRGHGKWGFLHTMILSAGQAGPPPSW